MAPSPFAGLDLSPSVLLEVLFASPVVWFPRSTPLIAVAEGAAVLLAVLAGLLLLTFGNKVDIAPVPDADVLWLSFVVAPGVEALHDTER